MIAIVDYGAGNLVSVKKALDWLGAGSAITSDPGQVAKATKIVLPGVGHFASTSALGRLGLQDAIADAIGRGIPFLGICVGMQWMFERSQESPNTLGLGVLEGECERFPASVKSPHVGWNQLEVGASSRLLRGVPSAVVCLFHAFFSCAGERHDGGVLRVWRTIFSGGGTGSSVWCAVSSRKIRGDWIEDIGQFLCALTC